MTIVHPWGEEAGSEWPGEMSSVIPGGKAASTHVRRQGTRGLGKHIILF